MTPRITLTADPPDNPALTPMVEALAAELRLAIADDPAAVRLVVTARRLELHLPDDRGLPVVIELSKIDTRSRAGGTLRQPLIKAIGIRHRDDRPTVIDATAGFGEDAHVLASFGCHITAIERHGIVATMLREAMQRAGSDVEVIHADACVVLPQLAAEVVYLDPMYPVGRKTAQRKPLRALRLLVGDGDDGTALFDAARCAATKRIVVKRPLRAAPLVGAPHHTHEGKAVRYDVYLVE
jgi:16S rRNA (guanine1516-N2)-methyltransferase